MTFVPSMLRHQPPHTDPLDFLAGKSEMAERIRTCDWSRHPFGPATEWPQSLRSALSICLHSAFPTAIYWGPELRLLYNDAWAPIPGPRHPAALGAPAREVWADIWHVLEPQFERLIATGEGLSVQDQLLPMRRFGLPEETYWSYSFTPIRGEDGAIVGVFNAGGETTATVLSQRRMRFLLELGQALRATTDPQAACSTAVRMLGPYLRVERASFCEVHRGRDDLETTAEWSGDGTAARRVTVDLSRLDALLDDTLRAGRVLRIDEVGVEPRTTAPVVREAFNEMGVAAALAVPQIAAGRLVAAICLYSTQPRHWTDGEVVTAEQVLERAWRSMERERTLQREQILAREIDHRARNALAVVQSLVRQTRAQNVSEFRRKVDDRIAALARAHSLLSREHWGAVDLVTLVEQELAPYLASDAPRVRVDGRSVPLTAELAQAMALVLHELATNAVKHGALAIDDGEVELRWRAEPGGELALDWIERTPDGSGHRMESKRKGFGSMLFSTVIEKQLRGRFERRWERGGVTFQLTIPLHDVHSRPASEVDSVRERRTGRKRILIVEDEAIVALDVASMLENLGYEIFAVCHTLADAFAAVDAENPELALLDANLGGRSVMPLAGLLRERGVPLIFATGYERMQDLPDPLRDVRVLSKPIAETALADAVRDALAGPA